MNNGPTKYNNIIAKINIQDEMKACWQLNCKMKSVSRCKRLKPLNLVKCKLVLKAQDNNFGKGNSPHVPHVELNQALRRFSYEHTLHSATELGGTFFFLFKKMEIGNSLKWK